MFIDETNWQELSSGDNLKVGDIVYIRVKYSYSNLWSKSIAAYYAEKAITKTGNYQILSINYSDDPGYFWFKLKVISNNPDVQTAGIGVGILITFILAITVVGLKVFNEPKIYRYKTQIAIAESSDPVIASQAIQSAAITGDSIGGSIQKAGTGIFLTLAASGLLYYLKKRR